MAVSPPAPDPVGDGLGATVEHTVWEQEDVDPAGVEEAMRALERERFQHRSGTLPARALNLVVIVDAAYAGEVSRRLDGIGRNAPSRTILVRVSPGRTHLSARVTMTSCPEGASGSQALNELVAVDIGEGHVPRLESIVDPMVMTDVPTLAWAPHGHDGALEAIVTLAQTVMLDSSESDDTEAGLDEAHRLLEADHMSVVDLAWLRATPWRQRLAAHFSPGLRHAELWSLDEVEIRHHPGSEAAAWLMLGWLGDRLRWEARDGHVVDADGHEVRLRLTPVDVGVQGLAGATVASRDGSRFALDRNPGGLRARRIDGDVERQWTVLGASRGEAGVLATALRRTLVPDDGYRGALVTARRLIPCT